MATSLTREFVFGDEDVAAAGTAVPLEAADTRVRSVMLIAKDDNTGRIFYGGTDVDSSTQRGLAAGESIVIAGTRPFEIGTIFIDSSVNGEGVDFVGVRV